MNSKLSFKGLLGVILIIFAIVAGSFVLYDSSDNTSPILAKQIDTECEYYKDFLGRVYYRTETSSLIIPLGTSSKWQRLEGVNSKDFAIHSKDEKYNSCLGFDGISVVHWDRVFRNADPDTFELLGLNYYKDDSKVYYRTNRLATANATTFFLLKADYKYPYCSGADAGYAKDSKNVYFEGRIIEKADVDTFEVFCHTENSSSRMRGEDANNMYIRGISQQQK